MGNFPFDFTRNCLSVGLRGSEPILNFCSNLESPSRNDEPWLSTINDAAVVDDLRGDTCPIFAG
jgi:hypothetical protein